MTDSFKALNENFNSEKLKEKFINFRKFISGNYLCIEFDLFLRNLFDLFLPGKPVWNNRSHFVSWRDFPGRILDNRNQVQITCRSL